jgi:hypothetical protein
VRMRSWVLAAALVVALAACSNSSIVQKRGPADILYSPNGEPLGGGALGRIDCETAMGRWLTRVDGNHDGTVEWDEFRADARRQFAAMDLDHDGFVTPSELQEYRTPFVREGRVRAAPGDSASGERPARRRGGEEEAPSGYDRPDPVMSADTTLRNKVSEADFMAQAERRFHQIDAARNGRLTADELIKACDTGKS